MKTLSRLSLLGMSAFLFAVPASAELKVGDQVPDFNMVGSDGKTYSNEQYEGKQAMVIAWFPKAFTGGCTKECQSLRQQGDALRQYDVAYFTASVDPVEKNREFAESLDLDYPILSDPDKSVARAFGCLNDRGVTNRWTYFVDRDGKVVHIDRSVKAAEHGETIVSKLDELGIAKK